MARHRICVIGAGVSGVSSAVRMLESLPGAEVVIMSDKFSPNTTSDVSGGFWEPHLLGVTPENSIRAWSKETLSHVIALADGPSAGDVGASLVSGYTVSDKPLEDPFWKDMVFGYRRLEQRELERFPGIKFGVFFTTAMLDMRLYLPWLMKRFVKNGGRIVQRHVNSIQEVAKEGYDIIVNCTGAWSRHLVSDTAVNPVRGQVMKVKAPWLKHFLVAFRGDDLGYLLPGTRYVVMGGTEQHGDWDRDTRLKDQTYIREICSSFIPSLKDVRPEIDEAGLRPGRTEVRLEREVIEIGGRQQHVIHNYGHGGAGVTLHWGCAGHVTRLATEILPTTSATAKL